VSDGFQPFWKVTAKNEVYIGYDRSNDGVTPWPNGHNPPNATDRTNGLPASTPAPSETVGSVPEARYVVQLGDDPHATPTFNTSRGTPYVDVTDSVGNDSHTFGGTTLGFDFPPAGSVLVDSSATKAHYAYYTATAQKTYNGVVYYANKPGQTVYRDYKVWDYNEVRPDYTTWPAGLRNDLGGLNGWGSAGVGYT
jgi:hypothetical protein